ncbi:MAG: sugar ABC transporter ATP-binding protein [Planctomycetes bacterium]|nr:sugar ABC transporter ATP-binding protein [Planctomycetota bacterium]
MPFLAVDGLSKRYAGVVALDGVSLHVDRGEWLAVAGSNGAGKSTLMRILAGLETRDAGRIVLDGAPIAARSAREAKALGIALIPQERSLCANLTIEDHLFLGRERTRRFGFVDHRGRRERAASALARVELDVPPTLSVGKLSTGNQQLLEIARALDEQARVLILDEPTSSLTPHESERLFAALARERERGVALLYVSHRATEIVAYADRVVGLTDGKNSGELVRRPLATEAVIVLMAGRAVTRATPTPREFGPPRLAVEELRTRRHAREIVTLDIRAGEIVGLAGLIGAGRSEVLRALFGADRALGGRLRVDGTRVEVASPRDAMRAGIALVPEDRPTDGVVQDASVRANIGMASLREGARRGFVDSGAERARARTWIERLGIKTRSDRSLVRKLSGGNQQKVAFAKWLARTPRVLLLDEPTRGVDVGAKEEIHRCIEDAARRGAAVLVASGELDELMRLCDRIVVLQRGAIRGELARSQFSERGILELATGAAIAPGAHA